MHLTYHPQTDLLLPSFDQKTIDEISRLNGFLALNSVKTDLKFEQESESGLVFLKNKNPKEAHNSEGIMLLLPGKKLALDLKDPIVAEDPSIVQSVKNAGYSVFKSKYKSGINFPSSKEYDLGFNGLISEDLLFFSEEVHRIMRTRKSAKKFDERMYRIIQELTDGIERISGVENSKINYQFVTYSLHLKQIGSDYLDQREEIERGIMKVFSVKASDAISNRLEEILGKIPLSKAVGLRSIVSVNEKNYHIPMIDLAEGIDREARVPTTDGRRDVPIMDRFKERLREMNFNPGMLVDSGKSFHYYGFNFLQNKEWADFMSESEKLFPFVDEGFLKIQKKSGSAVLRLSPAKIKPYQPTFYKIVD